MRVSGTPSTGQPRMQLSDRAVRTVVVCLPADAATAKLRQCAITVVLDREVFTADRIAGVLPHFTAGTRRASKLIDRWHGRTCGGPIKLLDLDAMRRAAVAAAAAQWLLWDQVVTGTKPANPFWWYVDRHTADSARYPIERARSDYLAQPRILAMQAHNALPGQPAPLPTPAVEALQAGYSTYLNTAWLAAVPAGRARARHRRMAEHPQPPPGRPTGLPRRGKRPPGRAQPGHPAGRGGGLGLVPAFRCRTARARRGSPPRRPSTLRTTPPVGEGDTHS